MNTVLLTPTADHVSTACKKFDRENQVIEESLLKLFNLFPNNTDLHHVLLKVVTLNSLYSTQIPVCATTIPGVEDVARHIHQNALRVDSALAAGSPEIVDVIARVTAPEKRDRNYFSFATKYCSWHNPESYPIYDSHVDKYLWSLQKQNRFADFFNANADLWDYPTFRKVMIAFCKAYGLDSFTFKQIDKFLWSCGGESSTVDT